MGLLKFVKRNNNIDNENGEFIDIDESLSSQENIDPKEIFFKDFDKNYDQLVDYLKESELKKYLVLIENQQEQVENNDTQFSESNKPYEEDFHRIDPKIDINSQNENIERYKIKVELIDIFISIEDAIQKYLENPEYSILITSEFEKYIRAYLQVKNTDGYYTKEVKEYIDTKSGNYTKFATLSLEIDNQEITFYLAEKENLLQEEKIGNRSNILFEELSNTEGIIKSCPNVNENDDYLDLNSSELYAQMVMNVYLTYLEEDSKPRNEFLQQIELRNEISKRVGPIIKGSAMLPIANLEEKYNNLDENIKITSLEQSFLLIKTISDIKNIIPPEILSNSNIENKINSFLQDILENKDGYGENFDNLKYLRIIKKLISNNDKFKSDSYFYEFIFEDFDIEKFDKIIKIKKPRPTKIYLDITGTYRYSKIQHEEPKVFEKLSEEQIRNKRELNEKLLNITKTIKNNLENKNNNNTPTEIYESDLDDRISKIFDHWNNKEKDEDEKSIKFINYGFFDKTQIYMWHPNYPEHNIKIEKDPETGEYLVLVNSYGIIRSKEKYITLVEFLRKDIKNNNYKIKIISNILDDVL